MAADAKAPSADDKSYIRVTHDKEGNPLAMETSIVHLVPQGNDRPGLQVDLVSAVHVADQSYYDALNKRFDGYDAVLFELVAPEGTVVPKGGLDRNRNALSAVQNGMKDLLELEYQLTGVDYTKKNFVHADLSPDEFLASMKEKGESFWEIFFRLMAAGMAKQAAGQKPPAEKNEHYWSAFGRILGSGDGQDATSNAEILLALVDPHRAIKLKRIMADQFSDMDILVTAFNGPNGSTLITERNKAALKVLKQEIAAGKKKIAIFYGGGHMPDLEPRLSSEFQMKRGGIEWLEAWNLRDKSDKK
ncbi:MAG TPA: hypothetical protein VGJ15_02005 [Pirellulales bacterium]